MGPGAVKRNRRGAALGRYGAARLTASPLLWARRSPDRLDGGCPAGALALQPLDRVQDPVPRLGAGHVALV
jgi:hypothetical protein